MSDFVLNTWEDDLLEVFCDMNNYASFIKRSFSELKIRYFSELFIKEKYREWLKQNVMKSDGTRWLLREKTQLVKEIQDYILESRKILDEREDEKEEALGSKDAHEVEQNNSNTTTVIELATDQQVIVLESDTLSVKFINGQVIYMVNLHATKLCVEDNIGIYLLLGESNCNCITSNGLFNSNRFDFQINRLNSTIGFILSLTTGHLSIEEYRQSILNSHIKEPSRYDIFYLLKRISSHISDLLFVIFPYEVPPDVLVAISSRFLTLYPLLDVLFEETSSQPEYLNVEVNGKNLKNQTTREFLSSKMKNLFKSRATRLRKLGLWVWPRKERDHHDSQLEDWIAIDASQLKHAHRGRQKAKILNSIIFEDDSIDENIDLTKCGFPYQKKKRVYQIFDEHHPEPTTKKSKK